VSPANVNENESVNLQHEVMTIESSVIIIFREEYNYVFYFMNLFQNFYLHFLKFLLRTFIVTFPTKNMKNVCNFE
jgi:hypothetical protein